MARRDKVVAHVPCGYRAPVRCIPVLLAALGACSDKPLAPATEAREKTVTLDQAAAKRPAGQVTTHQFYSAALGVDKSYYLYLPPSYPSDATRYPVIYLLHGLAGQEDSWIKDINVAKVADAMQLEAVLVMPDGDDSFYLDSGRQTNYELCIEGAASQGKDRKNCVRSPRYEKYIVEDLVTHIDANYRTLADRSGRAIGGISMGGYGALMLAMRHTDVFSSTASHSGIAALLDVADPPSNKQPAEGPSAHIRGLAGLGQLLLPILGRRLEAWQAHDPAHLAASLSSGDLSIYIDCGTEDDYQLHKGARHLHQVLKSAGIDHHFALVPGRHKSALWRERIDDSLAFHRRHFEGSGLPAKGDR